ncbi:MAG: hypothetical protein Q9159_003556 [Coniocarpon cinnabarinum]
MTENSTPAKSEQFQSPNFPQTPNSASFTYGNRQLPPIASPTHANGNRHRVSDIHIPPINPPAPNQAREHPMTPDTKRRRFSNGSANAVPALPALPPYPGSSHRGSFPYPNGPNHYPMPIRPQMPPPAQPQSQPQPTSRHAQVQSTSPAFVAPQGHPLHVGAKRASRSDDDMLVLPRDQQVGKSIEEILRKGSAKEQLRVLNMVSYPLPDSDPRSKTRGVAVAIEGDSTQTAQEVAQFLNKQLSQRREFAVCLAEGPAGPSSDKPATIREYKKLSLDMHDTSDKLVEYITGSTTSERREAGNRDEQEAMDIDPPTPVLLLNRYAHHAALSWAARVPLDGMYEAKQHWLWFATQWRGVVGPDVTVYIRDVSPEVFSKAKAVEICEDVRAIFVLRERNEKAEKSEDEGTVDDKTLRRVEFEVTEWIRHLVERGKKSEGA